jgi:hypothetical protein
MTLPTPYHPDSESVAVAWLSARLPVGVATTLPKTSSWPLFNGTVRGFATVTIVGGRTFEGPLRAPVVSVGTWAAVDASDQPQYGAAMQLAEILVSSCFAEDGRTPAQSVRRSDKYRYASVRSVRLVAEPRRVPDVDASVAHFETEIEIMWAEVQ